MSSTKQKLRLIGAFAALAMLALAASCTGFFPNPTLQTISLQPPTPTITVGLTQSMQAWGTDSNNNRSQLTKSVAWELTNVTPAAGTSGSVATIDPVSGLVTATSPGTMTIQASSQGISGTTTATVVQLVNSMTITPTSGNITADGGQTAAHFQISGVVQVGSGTQTEDLTSAVTLTLFQGGAIVPNVVTCIYNSTTDFQDCTAATGSVIVTNVYSLVVTYGGYTGPQVFATLTVNP
jgi:hypothetical protein